MGTLGKETDCGDTRGAAAPDVPAGRDDTHAAPDAGEPEALAEALRVADAAGVAICKLSAGNLTPRERRRVVSAFRRRLAPPRKRGRKRKASVTAAYLDWMAGMRGVRLYRKHVPHWERMSRWRRREMERALMCALHTRRRREQRISGQPLRQPVA